MHNARPLPPRRRGAFGAVVSAGADRAFAGLRFARSLSVTVIRVDQRREGELAPAARVSGLQKAGRTSRATR